MIAALYVQKGGVYYGLDDVDPWDEERDARQYAGPWPVVAHPPCNRWCRLSARRTRGEDGGTFAAALAAVRRFGGVLEHPAYSQAWVAFGLPEPIMGGAWQPTFTDPGWVCEVDQSFWGYPARKPTWLYYVGKTPPPPMPGHFPRHARSCASLWSSRRALTPPAFRDVLLAMARSATLAPSKSLGAV